MVIFLFLQLKLKLLLELFRRFFFQLRRLFRS